MSLKLLEENWGSIKNKVIKPLWKYKFCNLYQSVKLDENDFESLAGEALTKAFKNYKANESNIFTYATMVITKKAQTEIRDRKREKRQAEIISESLEQKLYEDGEASIGEMTECKDVCDATESIEIEAALIEINRHLRYKEQEVVKLSLKGYSDKDIIKMLNLDKDFINNMKKKLNENSSVRRVVRMLGYLGGTE